MPYLVIVKNGPEKKKRTERRIKEMLGVDCDARKKDLNVLLVIE